MRIFLAGATGVIGTRLLPLMLAEGHQVAAMTRTEGKLESLLAAGATPILCNIFDRDALIKAVNDYAPEVVIHQVTDLPDDFKEIRHFIAANARVRSEGTENLLFAAAGVRAKVIAQSIAWPGGPVVEAHEKAVVAAGGTVIRYGQFYGPDTYFENAQPPAPRIHIENAARRTMDFFAAKSGIFSIVDES